MSNHPYVKDTLIWVPLPPSSSSNSNSSTPTWVKGEVNSVSLPNPTPSPEDYITLNISYQPDPTSGEPPKSVQYSFPLSILTAAGQAPSPTALAGSGSGSGGALQGKDEDGRLVGLPPLRNPEALATSEDLADLSNLNEPSVLHAIQERYLFRDPYTYSGIVLVALNPFTPLNIYGPDYINSYSGKKRGELSPHIFAIAEDALDCMRRGAGGGGADATGAGDQTIVVSGESGAGKTVSAKYILRYFASVEDPHKDKSQDPHSSSSVAKRQRSRTGGGAVDENSMSATERQILASNPIMEAFGNAKTTRNDNSSRFGKYIEILFDKEHEIVGARIRTYLLERSRLVYQPEIERNYHIFYQLLAGAPEQEKKDLSLDRLSSDFAYLAGGGPTSTYIQGVDDAAEFADTQKALSTVGVSVERQWQIFRLLAALLHLGNVNITQMRTEANIPQDDEALTLATGLLGVDKEEFRKWTLKKQLITRSDKIVTSLSAPQAAVVRDSVAKFIYSCLFDWLVSIINHSLAGPDSARAIKFIGVLDIYGFEHFKKNSFEQFCINWANEKLQQEFNAHVFKLEQEEYVREEINWTFIEFADNQMCIDVIEGKMGILTLLDEESRLPAGADATFAGKLFQQINKPEQKSVFKKPRFGQNAFTVAHYAHDVTYDVDGFIEKNRDTVPDEHMTLLKNSSNQLLKDCLDAAFAAAAVAKETGDKPTVAVAKRPGGAATAKKPTLGSIFKHSLANLMDTINNTNVHYIRCIKPNEAKQAWEFDSEQVLSQLRACGVLETIRISCAGYPNRWTFEEFVNRYDVFIPSDALEKFQQTDDLRAVCAAILEKTVPDSDKYQIGLTKIFFRPGMVAVLDRIKKQRLDYLATLVQKNYKRYRAVNHYRKLRDSTITIQTQWRGYLARRVAADRRREKAATLIQSISKMYLARRAFLETRSAVIKIQSAARGYRARTAYAVARQENAATKLQAMFRGRAVRREFELKRKRVILLQGLWRRRSAKKQLVVLRAEAKSASAYKEVAYKLENKVVELTQSLQQEKGKRKDLEGRFAALQAHIDASSAKQDQDQHRIKELTAELQAPKVPRSQFDDLLAEKEEVDRKIREATAKLGSQDAEIAALSEQLSAQSKRMQDSQTALAAATARTTEESSAANGLRIEIASLKEQLNRANALASLTRTSRDPPQSPTTPILNGHTRGLDFPISPVPPRRRNRRQSATGFDGHTDRPRTSTDERLINGRKESDQLKAASVALPHGHTVPNRELHNLETAYESVEDGIVDLLENGAALDEDVLNGLIRGLKIINPSLNSPPNHNEVMFPGHLISLITNEMWKYGLIKESERFLANVMQTIQQYVMSFHDDAAIIPGFFWLTNVHEILSFVTMAEDDMLQGIGPGAEGLGRDFEWEVYERLVTIVKHDLDSLEYNIYHTVVQEIKKTLNKMIIPALIETQALPGFVSNEKEGRLFNRLIGSTEKPPAYSMDDVLELLNKVYKALKSYHLEESILQQVIINELLKMIGATSFNEMLMRRNFCSWKRAMQIQYNITRLEEWCKSHDMAEGTLPLESLIQAAKLLQLKKASRTATAADIDILFDVCWILSPTQIQKLISQYHVAAYETPISADIMRLVAQRVNTNDKGDHLLLPPESEEAGPYSIPDAREIHDLETYVPAYLQVPHVRKLAMLAA